MLNLAAHKSSAGVICMLQNRLARSNWTRFLESAGLAASLGNSAHWLSKSNAIKEMHRRASLEIEQVWFVLLGAVV